MSAVGVEIAPGRARKAMALHVTDKDVGFSPKVWLGSRDYKVRGDAAAPADEAPQLDNLFPTPED